MDALIIFMHLRWMKTWRWATIADSWKRKIEDEIGNRNTTTAARSYHPFHLHPIPHIRFTGPKRYTFLASYYHIRGVTETLLLQLRNIVDRCRADRFLLQIVIHSVS